MPGIFPPGQPPIPSHDGSSLGPSTAQTTPAVALPPDVFKGYADLRNTVAHHLNRHLYRAAKWDSATLLVLNRKRKVRR